jgi:hypothetical protein
MAAMERERPGYTADQQRDDRLFAQSGFLRRRDGSREMVTRWRINGVFYDQMYLPLNLYTAFLDELQRKLVALNGSKENPQPKRYVELFTDGPERRFAEIEMVVEPDNTVRIHILNVRSEPASVIASSDFEGSCPTSARGPR